MREICDIIVAVNRPYGKSDYIPIICWGNTARYAADFTVGTNCKIIGRLQSRPYKKRLENGEVNSLVAYEVSAIKIERSIPFV
jgi:single-stranded DNA-binding protein